MTIIEKIAVMSKEEVNNMIWELSSEPFSRINEYYLALCFKRKEQLK